MRASKRLATPSRDLPRKLAPGCPPPEERRALQLPAGAPVLTVVRTAYDTNDVAVEVCDTVKVASAYLLEYDFFRTLNLQKRPKTAITP